MKTLKLSMLILLMSHAAYASPWHYSLRRHVAKHKAAYTVGAALLGVVAAGLVISRFGHHSGQETGPRLRAGGDVVRNGR